MLLCEAIWTLVALWAGVIQSQSCSPSTTLIKSPGTFQDRSPQTGNYASPKECHWKVVTSDATTVVQLTFSLLNLNIYRGSSNDVVLVNLGPQVTLPTGWSHYNRHAVLTGSDSIGAYDYTQTNSNVCAVSTSNDPATTDLTKNSLLTDPARQNTWIYFIGQYADTYNPLTLVGNAPDVYIIFRSFVEYSMPPSDANYGMQVQFAFVSAYCASLTTVSPVLTVSDKFSISSAALIQDNMAGTTKAGMNCTWLIKPKRLVGTSDASFDSLWFSFPTFSLPGSSYLLLMDAVTLATLALFNTASPPTAVYKFNRGAIYARYITDTAVHRTAPTDVQAQTAFALTANAFVKRGGVALLASSPKAGFVMRRIIIRAMVVTVVAASLIQTALDLTHQSPSVFPLRLCLCLLSDARGDTWYVNEKIFDFTCFNAEPEPLPVLTWSGDSIEQSCPANYQCPPSTQCSGTGKCVSVLSPSLPQLLPWWQHCFLDSDCPEATLCNANNVCLAPNDYALQATTQSQSCSINGWPTSSLAGVTIEIRILVTTPQASDIVLSYPGLNISQTSRLTFSVSNLPLWTTSVNIADGEWHNLVWVWDNNLGTMALYSQTTLLTRTSVTVRAPALQLQQPLNIGGFAGSVAYLRIWDIPRPITSFFTDAAQFERQNVLVDYRFADGSARDLSPNGNDVTVVQGFSSIQPSHYNCLANPLDISIGLTNGALLAFTAVTTGPWAASLLSVAQTRVFVVAATSTQVQVSVDNSIAATITLNTTKNFSMFFRLQFLNSTTAEMCINDVLCVTVPLSTTPATSFSIDASNLTTLCLMRAENVTQMAAIVSVPTVTIDLQNCQFPFQLPVRNCGAFASYLAAKQLSASTLLTAAQVYTYANLDQQEQGCTCDIMPVWNVSYSITRVDSGGSPPLVTLLVSYVKIKTSRSASSQSAIKCGSSCYVLEPNVQPATTPVPTTPAPTTVNASTPPPTTTTFLQLISRITGGAPVPASDSQLLNLTQTIVSGATVNQYFATREFNFAFVNGSWQVLNVSDNGNVSPEKCLITGPDAPSVVDTFSSFQCKTTGTSTLAPPVALSYCIVNNTKKTCLSERNSCGLLNGQVTLTSQSGSFDDNYTASVTNGVHLCTFNILPAIPSALLPFATLVYIVEKTVLGSTDTLTISSNGATQTTLSGTILYVVNIVQSRLNSFYSGLPTFWNPVAAGVGLSFTLSTTGDKSGVPGDGFVASYSTMYSFPSTPTAHVCSAANSVVSIHDSVVVPTYDTATLGVVFPNQTQCDYLVQTSSSQGVVWLQFLEFTLATDRIELYDIVDSTPVLLANLTNVSQMSPIYPILFNGQSDYIVTSYGIPTPTTVAFWLYVPTSVKADCTNANACNSNVPKPMKVIGTDNGAAGFSLNLDVATGFLSINYNTGTLYTMAQDVRLAMWCYVAFVHRGSDVFGYVNATRVAITTSSVSTVTTRAPDNVVYIGGQANLPDSSTVYFSGMLGNIILYSSSKTMFDLGAQMLLPCDISDASLLLCYAFATPYSPTDSSRYSNNCIYHGTTWTGFELPVSSIYYKTFTAISSQLLVRYIPASSQTLDIFRFVATVHTCPSPCFGECIRGRCICNVGTTGPSCNITLPSPCFGHVIMAPSSTGGLLSLPSRSPHIIDFFVPHIAPSKTLGLQNPIDCSWHFRKTSSIVAFDFSTLQLDSTSILSIYDGDHVVPTYLDAFNLTAQLAMDRATFFNRGATSYSGIVFQNVTRFSATATLSPQYTTYASNNRQVYHVVQYRRGQACRDGVSVGLTRAIASQLISTFWYTQSQEAYASTITPVQLYFNQFDANTANVTVEFSQSLIRGSQLSPYPTVFRFQRRVSQPFLTCKNGSTFGLDTLNLDQTVLYTRQDLSSRSYATQTVALPIFNYTGNWTMDTTKTFSGVFRTPFVLNQVFNQSLTVVITATVVLNDELQYIFSQEDNTPGSMCLKLVPTTKGSGIWVFAGYNQYDTPQMENPTSLPLDTITLAVTFDRGVVTYFVNGMRYYSFDTVQAFKTCVNAGGGSCTPPLVYGFTDTAHKFVIGGTILNGKAGDIWAGTISTVQVYNMVLDDVVIASQVPGASTLESTTKASYINAIISNTQAIVSTIEVATVLQGAWTATSRLLRKWSLIRYGCQTPPPSFLLDAPSVNLLVNSTVQQLVWNKFDDTSALVTWRSTTSSTYIQTTLTRTKSYGYNLTDDVIVGLLIAYGRTVENRPYHITQLIVNSISPTSATVSFSFLDTLLNAVNAKATLSLSNNTWSGPSTVQRLVPPDFGIIPPVPCLNSEVVVMLSGTSGIITDGQPTPSTRNTHSRVCMWMLQAPPGQTIRLQLDFFNVDCTEGVLAVIDLTTSTPTALCGALSGQSFTYGSALKIVFGTGPALSTQPMVSTGFYAKYWLSNDNPTLNMTSVPISYSPWQVLNSSPSAGLPQCQLDTSNISNTNPWQVASVALVSSLNTSCYNTESHPPDAAWVVSSYGDSQGNTTCSQWELDETMPWTAYDIENSGPTELNTAPPTLFVQDSSALLITSTNQSTFFESTNGTVEIRYQSSLGSLDYVRLRYYLPRVYYAAPPSYRPPDGYFGDGSYRLPFTRSFSYLLGQVLQPGDMLRLFPGRYEGADYCNLVLSYSFVIEAISGNGLTTIDCQNVYRGWQLVHTTGLTILKGLEFTGCTVSTSPMTGAALYISGNTRLDACRFESNSHKAQGTVAIVAPSVSHVRNCGFWTNSGKSALAILSATATIRNSIFVNNYVLGNGALYVSNYVDGATSLGNPSTVNVTNTTFSSNMGSPAIRISSRSVIWVSDSLIQLNWDGGIVVDASYLSLVNSLMLGNYASAVMLSGSSFMESKNCRFFNNLGTQGAVIMMTASSWFGENNLYEETNSRFIGNAAGVSLSQVATGGAISFSNCPSIIIKNNSFHYNSAPSSGGAVMLNNASVLFGQNQFLFNTAGDHGGAIRLIECSTNISSSLLMTRAEIFQWQVVAFEANYFAQNTAVSGGGGVSIDSSNGVKFSHDQFDSNTAIRSGSGGALEISLSGNVALDSMMFQNCSAYSGGAVSLIIVGPIYFTNCQFTACQSLYSGGSLAATGSQFFLTNVTFDKSSATQFGGAMVVQAQTTVMQLTNISFTNGKAQKGGALYIIDCSIAQGSIENISFANLTASIMGGAIYAVLIRFWLHNLVSVNTNSANGGFLSLEDSTATISNATILNSTAFVNGGSIYSIVSTLSIFSSQFYSNNATNYGGCVYGFASNIGLRSTIISGSSAKFGGGLYASSATVMLITSTLVGNIADSGGGLYCDLTDVMVQGSLFRLNFASGAGGATFIAYNLVDISESIFSNNSAKQGGGILLSKTQGFTIQGCVYTNNSAHHDSLDGAIQQGGAIVIVQISQNSSVSNSIFQSNSAIGAEGGAIYATGSAMQPEFEILLQNTTFVENQAGTGGSLYLDSMLVHLDETYFQSNIATSDGGGGIFWRGVEPFNIQSITAVTFVHNSAPYGPNYASVPYALLPSYSYPNVIDWGEVSGQNFQGSFLVYIVDQYSQVIVTENSLVVALQTNTAGATMTGMTQATAVNGVCTFNQAGVQKSPGKTVQVVVSSPPLRSLGSVTVPIRKCIRGEVAPTGMNLCIACAFGKFSWNTSDTICHDCPKGAVCGGGDAVDALAGYWRFANSTGVCADPKNPYDNCVLKQCLGTSCGGLVQGSEQAIVQLNSGTMSLILNSASSYEVNQTLYVAGIDVQVVSVESSYLVVTGTTTLPTDGSVDIFLRRPEICDVGYTGNLCLQCNNGYTRSGSTDCVPCPSSFALTILVLIGGVICVIAIVTVLIIMAINKAKKAKSITSIMTKIFTSYMQLIVLAQSFDVNWPHEVTEMFNTQGLLASPGDKLISIDCLVDHYKQDLHVESFNSISNYYSQLLVFLCLPILGVLGPLVFWTIRFWRLRFLQTQKDWYAIVQPDKGLITIDELPAMFEKLKLQPSDLVLLTIQETMGTGTKPMTEIKSAYLNALRRETRAKLILSIIVIMFLIHPSLTKTIFQMFSCSQLGTDMHGNALYFMDPDLDVACYTTSHYRWIYCVGIPSLIIYTLGIPTLAYTILHIHRHNLNNLKTKLEFGFLYTGFKLKHFYWEIWVMMRKIVVCFISVFLKRSGVGPQALAATFLVFVSYHLQMECLPYENPKVNRLEQYSLLTSLFTLFCGLFLYQIEIIGDWRGFFGIFVIIVNSLFVAHFVRMLAFELRHKAKDAIYKITGEKHVAHVIQSMNTIKKQSSLACKSSDGKISSGKVYIAE
ncbi:Aste57867_286 [Aphanomyces stellatus]|uniref:Aste57867_286 protein n=1 Tax=Aphanomyces stellatus TaxID=120398 RepID=A0A485K2N8_9STRA|nr:hypothetical protein As57867_000286 [Aphanomyces stellatus]VFT77512.1 Aste57867_286 [Aphanomyces stellatus]